MSKKNPYLGNMDMYLEDLELNANLILSFKNWKGKTALINNQVAIINDLINAIREDLNIKKKVMQKSGSSTSSEESADSGSDYKGQVKIYDPLNQRWTKEWLEWLDEGICQDKKKEAIEAEKAMIKKLIEARKFVR